MPSFPGFFLTKDGLDLQSKCYGAGAKLTFTAVKIGSGRLPPDGVAFGTTHDGSVVTIFNQEVGVCTGAVDVDTGFSISTNTQGTADRAEVSQITCLAASNLSGGEYLKLYSPTLDYHVFFTVDGVGADPFPVSSIPIMVSVGALDSAVQVAEKMAEAIDSFRVEAATMKRMAVHQMDAAISSVEVIGDGTSKLPVQFDNSALDVGFEWREIGVFATDPDLGEILYSYTNSGDSADPVPATGGTTVAEYALDVYTKIGSITDVSAVVVPSGTYATLANLKAYATLANLKSHMEDKTAHNNSWTLISADHTAVNGQKLFVDTSSGVVIVTVPEHPDINDRVDFADYAKTWDQNKLIVKRATSGEKIQGREEDMDVDMKGLAFGLVYAGDAKGWVIV